MNTINLNNLTEQLLALVIVCPYFITFLHEPSVSLKMVALAQDKNDEYNLFDYFINSGNNKHTTIDFQRQINIYKMTIGLNFESLL